MEEPEVLLRTVDSIVGCDYPTSCLHVFLSFDGDQENDLYLSTLEQLGVPLKLERYPKSIDVTYRDCRVTVSRFAHGGKRSCQKKTFALTDKIYADYLRRNDNLFLLFIDSDCILDRSCIQNFIFELDLKPGSKHNKLAQTGIITTTTVKHSLITVLQDIEYIHGQLFERSVESGCGAVTCLPGALTILRFSAFRRMAKVYFADKAEQCDDLFDYGKCHLGEDRWLTHLFMIGATERYQIQMNTGAFCKTEAVQTFKSLLKQRRRWFLGFITNEACMLTDARLWRRYPFLILIRLAQNTIRTTALLFFIMILAILSSAGSITHLPIGFMAVSLGLNWLLMLYFGVKLGRYKIMLYPIMFVINPFVSCSPRLEELCDLTDSPRQFNWIYMVYGIFTAGQRTWGGPRADAGKADVQTTPEQVVEKAAAQGDELNVVPDTFRPALTAARRRLPHHAPLMPSERLEGKFRAAEEVAAGWHRQINDSDALDSSMVAKRAEEARLGVGVRRDSDDSVTSAASTATSIHTPRKVESIIGVDRAGCDGGRRDERAVAGGGTHEFQRSSAAAGAPYAESIRSSRSDSSVSLHFNVPPRGRSAQVIRAEPQHHGQTVTAPQQLSAERSGYLSNPTTCGPSPGGQPTLPSRRRPRRTDRSPLARKSFTHLAADSTNTPAGDGPESSGRVVRRRSTAGAERSYRSISVDRDGRRRLRKWRPGSRVASEE